jgi:hypothetical protein
MASITTLNKDSVLRPYRKVEIKRRLDDGSGDYESSWYDVTDYIKSFGTVSWKLDTETVGVFTQSTLTLIGVNFTRQWDSPDNCTSLFNGFLTRYKTLFRITIGLKDSTGTVYPTNASFWYGIMTDDIQLTETDATIVVNSLTQMFREQGVSSLSLAGTDTASTIITKVLNIQDDSGNNVFDRFITGSSAGTTSLQYADATGGTNLEQQTAWDIINRMCLTEDYCAYIGNNGSFYFKGKSTGTDIAWKFNGIGVNDEIYGVNIASIRQSNNIWSKVYNKVVVEYQDGAYGSQGDNWSQGDRSSSDKYGERILNISEHWLGSAGAGSVAGSLYNTYSTPKKEVVLTTTTFNPELKLLDLVEVNYKAQNSTSPAGIWGVSCWGSSYSDGIGLWTGKLGGIYLNAEQMSIIGIDLDMDSLVSTFTLRGTA